MKPFCILIILLSLCSCHNRNQSPISIWKDPVVIAPRTPINDKNLMDSLINISINKGDTSAFNRVFSYYAIEGRKSELLAYSITMANKYNYIDAYFYVYMTLDDPKQGGGLNTLDERTKNLALYYLFRAHELGYKEATNVIEYIFGEDSTIPKSSYFLNKIAEFDSSLGIKIKR